MLCERAMLCQPISTFIFSLGSNAVVASGGKTQYSNSIHVSNSLANLCKNTIILKRHVGVIQFIFHVFQFLPSKFAQHNLFDQQIYDEAPHKLG